MFSHIRHNISTKMLRHDKTKVAVFVHFLLKKHKMFTMQQNFHPFNMFFPSQSQTVSSSTRLFNLFPTQWQNKALHFSSSSLVQQPRTALAISIVCLQISLYSDSLLHSVIFRSNNELPLMLSSHFSCDLPTGLLSWNFPSSIFFGILEVSIWTIWLANCNLLNLKYFTISGPPNN